MYPAGLSPIGAVLLRVATSLFALNLLDNTSQHSAALSAAAWLCAAALSFGVFTRIFATLVALYACTVWHPGADATDSLLVTGGLGSLALALIGAGPWSVDALLFGRRVIDLDG